MAALRASVASPSERPMWKAHQPIACVRSAVDPHLSGWLQPPLVTLKYIIPNRFLYLRIGLLTTGPSCPCWPAARRVGGCPPGPTRSGSARALSPAALVAGGGAVH